MGSQVISYLVERWRWLAAIAAFLIAFAFIDLPQTVQLKTLLVRALPLSPETKDSVIKNLCVGAFSGAADFAWYRCYSTFYGDEYYEYKEAKEKQAKSCLVIKDDMNKYPDRWTKLAGLSFMYVGPEKESQGAIVDLSTCK
jgi:hypothetical protein